MQARDPSERRVTLESSTERHCSGTIEERAWRLALPVIPWFRNNAIALWVDPTR